MDELNEIIDDIVERADIHGDRKYGMIYSDIRNWNVWMRAHIGDDINTHEELEKVIKYMFGGFKHD